ncbi:MAG: amino acid ABC transporter permease [Erysipelotrichaceae bacterium]|nr:amino acid ABC transporter permease [Erysipelotrichaceae bacterium]
MTLSIFDVFIKYYPLFLKGLVGTLKYAAIAVFFGSILGSLISLLNIAKNTVLNTIGNVYVTVLRGTPLLVQMYIAYYFLPMAIPALNALNKETCVIISLILNSSAYVAEIIRGGISSVDIGQMEAARSLGMSYRHAMVKVILPQAIRAILPSLANEYIAMIKETSLAGTFMLYELMYTRTLLANKYLIWQPLFIIAFIYLVVTVFLSMLVKLLEKRLAVSERA